MNRPNQRVLLPLPSKDLRRDVESTENLHLSAATSVQSNSTRVDVFPPPPESVAGAGHASLNSDTRSISLTKAYDAYKDTTQYRQQATALANRTIAENEHQQTKPKKILFGTLCVLLIFFGTVGGTFVALVTSDNDDGSQTVDENTQGNDNNEENFDGDEDEQAEDEGDQNGDLCRGSCFGDDNCCDFDGPIPFVGLGTVDCTLGSFFNTDENRVMTCDECTDLFLVCE